MPAYAFPEELAGRLSADAACEVLDAAHAELSASELAVVLVGARSMVARHAGEPAGTTTAPTPEAGRSPLARAYLGRLEEILAPALALSGRESPASRGLLERIDANCDDVAARPRGAPVPSPAGALDDAAATALGRRLPPPRAPR